MPYIEIDQQNYETLVAFAEVTGQTVPKLTVEALNEWWEYRGEGRYWDLHDKQAKQHKGHKEDDGKAKAAVLFIDQELARRRKDKVIDQTLQKMEEQLEDGEDNEDD